MRRGIAAVVAVLALAGTVAAAPPSGAAQETVERVLVVSLPHVSWEDLAGNELPNLEHLLAESGVADLTTRGVARRTRLSDGYATLGAGTRAVGPVPATDEAYEVDEPYGDGTAVEAYAQRTGKRPDSGVVALGIGEIIEVNDALRFNAEPGALGARLARAGWRSAVIGNADGTAGAEADPVVVRPAAAAIMDEDGYVPGGHVSPALLEPDANAPYGVRLDLAAVGEAFDAEWRARSVVLVEASDLVRYDTFRTLATPEQQERLLAAVLRHTDELVGRLLERVDPERDAVLVVGPSPTAAEITTTVAAVRAPGMEPGLLLSATTRRSGFVQLIDVAPTILELTGLDRPSSMEGRSMDIGREGGSLADRQSFLVDADRDAQLRDELIGGVATTMHLLGLGVSVALVGFLWRPGLRRRTAVRGLSLGTLAFGPAVLLAQAVPVYESGVGGYVVFVAVVTVALAILWWGSGRLDPLAPVTAALGFTVALLVLDAVLGSPLQFNSAIGFSPTAAGRFTGFSNTGYAMLGASAVLLSGLLAHLAGPRRGPWLGVGLLVGVVLVDGAPSLGSDVGGVLSMVPAFGVTAVMLLGGRVRLRTVALVVAAALLAVVGFGFLDLLRPSSGRTHLGRLFETIGDEGWDGFSTVVLRKAEASYETIPSSMFRWLVPIVIGLFGYLLWRRDALARLARRIPPMRAAFIGFVVLSVLGLLLNDSGISVPAVMAFVGVGALGELVVATTPALSDEPSSGALTAVAPGAGT